MPTPRDPPPIGNEVTLARYPFLPQASGWIQNLATEHQIDLDELLDGEWMEKARQRARIRLIDSIESKEGVAVVGGDIFTEEGRIIEAFSFYKCFLDWNCICTRININCFYVIFNELINE